MNKQEAIEKINELKELSHGALGGDWIELGIDKALDVVKQLDDAVKPPKPKPLSPEKPVVPQLIADFYEAIKDSFEWSLYKLCVDFNKRELQEDLSEWFECDAANKPIETLVMMHKFGYEIEKEKLYTVEIPNPNKIGNEINVLMMNGFRQVIIVKEYGDNWKKENGFRLTESEIKKDFGWAWQFAEEVEE